jgi:hypothetical protein
MDTQLKMKILLEARVDLLINYNIFRFKISIVQIESMN